MFFVKVENHFDSSHFLDGYSGKCRNIHGHRWKIIVCVKGKELVQEGSERSMLIDFNILKKEVSVLCQQLDHCLLYETGTLKKSVINSLIEDGFEVRELSFRPTAEEFAAYFYRRLKETGISVSKVEVYESPDTCAIYEE